MPLETGNYISDLDESWPLGGDPTLRGDDHLRLIKSVLKTQFPGALGNGFASAINVTETEFTYLEGVTSGIQTQLDALDARITGLEGVLSAASGTAMAFFQASAPTGWTQNVTNNDAMMRVVSSSGGGAGGTDSAILNNKVPSHTHTFSATTNATGNHTHTLFSKNPGGRYMSSHGGGNEDLTSSNKTTSTAGSHTHSVSGTSAANSGAASWTPKYVDMIIATKD